MVDIDTLMIGDTVFYVSTQVNQPRNRHTMTDEHGVKWFRYDDLFIYKIKKMIVSGYVDHIIVGTVCPNEENLREYYFFEENGSLLDYCFDKHDTMFRDNSFLTLEEAEQFVNSQKEKERQ